MPNLAPVLGFRTQTDAIAALNAEGLSYEAIAERIGRDAIHVQATLDRSRRLKRNRRVLLPMRVLEALADDAAYRGISVTELALQLLELVARDELVDALLGDPETARA